MVEIDVRQRSDEWFEIRNNLLLTASKFGEALGVGRGKPYDYLKSLLQADDQNEDSTNTRHGNEMEPIINEAYQILTGHDTRSSGLWIPDEQNSLHGMCAASPDAKVYDRNDSTTMIGLAEYKAPVYSMYTMDRHPPHGIPRYHMAQIHGQMAFANKSWCDFMAVCCATRDIRLYKVHFSAEYWSTISAFIQEFCFVLKETRRREKLTQDVLDFQSARLLKSYPARSDLYRGEDKIRVDNLLTRTDRDIFQSNRGSFSFDFLMGSC